MITIDVVLLVVAFVSFLLATFNVAVPRVHLIALGLAAWVLSILI